MNNYVESRVVIEMNTAFGSNPAYYSMVSLADHEINFPDPMETRYGIQLSPDRRLIGITVLQMGVMHQLHEANRENWALFSDNRNGLEQADIFTIQA
jgi:hypothetical protein